MTEPAKPSQDFFGLIDGAIGCLPRNTPAAYPPVSESTTAASVTRIRKWPSSGDGEQRGEPGQERHVDRDQRPAVRSRW